MNIIFHYPLPLNSGARSASGIRPLRMLKAFQDLGCQVDVVSGYSKERKRAIKRIKENVRNGMEYQFVYSESSTMPTILTDPYHLPLHPLMDLLFFRFCRNHGIPVGLFYRDIYWRFEGYAKGLNPIKASVAKMAYWFDLWAYQSTLTKLYLPSLEMGCYVPIVDQNKFEALPPGHQISEQLPFRTEFSSPLKLFYVGGMSDHYQMHKLFEVVNELPQVKLTICTREAEWQAVKNEYPNLGSNINVIHKVGREMEAFLNKCDVALLFVKPHEYWRFASPVKLYEYVGFGKPIVATIGTLAGAFVSEHKVGWALQYETRELKALFQELLNSPEQLTSLQADLGKVSQKHTWRSRAQQVLEGLSR